MQTTLAIFSHLRPPDRTSGSYFVLSYAWVRDLVPEIYGMKIISCPTIGPANFPLDEGPCDQCLRLFKAKIQDP